MLAGIALLIEFEGGLSISAVDSEPLRHFRDVHLARTPANENRVRSQYSTRSMTDRERSTRMQLISEGLWHKNSVNRCLTMHAEQEFGATQPTNFSFAPKP